jgi:hypothetical protein
MLPKVSGFVYFEIAVFFVGRMIGRNLITNEAIHFNSRVAVVVDGL